MKIEKCSLFYNLRNVKKDTKNRWSTITWEQRKLGEIGNTFTGISGKTKEDFGCGNAKYITYMNVFQNVIADYYGTDAIEIDDKQNSVQYGDVLFTTSSETSTEVGMSTVWLYDENNVYLNSFYFGYRLNIQFDYYFFGYLLRTPTFRNKITLLAQGISRYNISKIKVMNIGVLFPDLEEQQKVGEIFKVIDTHITYHQRDPPQ